MFHAFNIYDNIYDGSMMMEPKGNTYEHEIWTRYPSYVLN